MKKDNHYIEILFEEDYTAGKIIKETLWAIDLGNQSYQIDSISFFAFSVACGDIFSAVLENGVLVAKELLQSSGNSTVRIIFIKYFLIDTIREILLVEYACDSEVSNYLPQLIAVDIPSHIDYTPIKLFLDKGEANGEWKYAATCLSAIHSPKE
jgi:hypothetical protein